MVKAPKLPSKLIKKHGMAGAWKKFKKTRAWRAYAKAKGKQVTKDLLR